MGSTRERVYSSRNDRASMVLGSSLHYRYLRFSLEATLAYFVAYEKITTCLILTKRSKLPTSRHSPTSVVFGAAVQMG
jgi:hypothetical protein